MDAEEGMTDLWDEKPRAGDFDHVILKPCYNKEKMDAWLEKVKKILIDDRETIHFLTLKQYHKRIDKLTEKAEKFDKGERVWVPSRFYSTFKIKEDDIPMMILEAE